MLVEGFEKVGLLPKCGLVPMILTRLLFRRFKLESSYRATI
jgi:hypothetical protein